ncbi:MAG: serine/threonine protein kinase [Candidatus Wallbacteria bacterium]|nr:serine/threonine protein kinase [Candidatus Wallbacteria bacterium]
MDDDGRELDLYSGAGEPKDSKEPEAPSTPSEAPLDLYEGVEPPVPTGARLLDRPKDEGADTFRKKAPDAAGAGRAPDWFDSLWALFPANLRDRYRPSGVIGEGGMGIVIEAHDRHLNRTVAIKGLRDPGGVNAEQRARQAGEARITARLSHPNILPIYDLWRDSRGNPWCSMMRVPGDSPTMARELRQLASCGCIEERPLSRLLVTFLEICRALAHAHRLGIIHRDLKPENIFIAPAGEALVADWGVALDLNDPAAAGPALVGTPGYAAPEQLGAFGRPFADARSDVYSLGVILFELVVGRRFTDLPTIDSDKVVHRRPHAELAVIPERIPRELAAIIQKATNPEPAQRYADVGALIAAVDTYQMGGLLEGLAYTPRERLVKWARARPAATAGVALLVLVTLGVLLNISFLNFRHRREKEALRLALEETNFNSAQLYAEKASGAAARKTFDRATHFAALALEKCPEGRALPTATACSIVAGRADAGRLLWTVRSPGRRPQLAVAFSPDGRAVAFAGHDGVIRVRDIETQSETAALSGHAGWVGALGYARAGELLVSGGEDGTLRVWDARSGAARAAVRAHTAPVLALAIDRAGARVMTAGADQTMACWELAEGTSSQPGLLWRQQQPVAGLGALDIDLAGSRVVAASGQQSVPLRDVTSGELKIAVVDTASPARIARFSPDGTVLALGGCPDEDGRHVLLWDLEKWQAAAVLAGHQGPVTAMAFGPGGGLLATASDDMTIRVWTLGNRQEALVLEGHADAVHDLAFSPDGQTLVSAGRDGTMRLWDVRVGSAAAGRLAIEQEVTGLDFQPAAASVGGPASGVDSALFATLDAGGVVRLWDLESRCQLSRTSAAVAASRGPVFERSGRTVLFENAAGEVVTWDVVTGRESGRRAVGRSRSRSLRAMPDGQVRAATLSHGQVRWEELGGASKVLGAEGGVAFTHVAICSRGRFVAAAEEGRGVHVWDGETGRDLGRIEGPVEGLDQLIYSPDARTLIRVGGARAFHVWDLVAGDRDATALEGHSSRILAAAFSADGKSLATGSKDGEIVLWDMTARRVKARLKSGERGVGALAFSPDGRWLAAAIHDSSLVFWEIGLLEDPKALLSRMKGRSPFELSNVELVVNGREVPSPVLYPSDHAFRWLAAARGGDRLAMLRAGLLMAAVWRRGEDLPRGWGREARAWLERAGRPDLAIGVE